MRPETCVPNPVERNGTERRCFVNRRLGVRLASPAPEFKRICAIAVKRQGNQRQQPRQQLEKSMGLYEAIDSLPEGARLEYKSADGTTIIYEPYVRAPGVLDVIVRKRSNNATGAHDEVRHEYEGV